MNTMDFMDAVKDRLELPSDRKFGQALDIPNGVVSNYRNGKRKLTPADCRKIASALDVPSAYVLAEIQAERAKEPEDRADWKLLAGLAKKGAAIGVGAMAIISALTVGDTETVSLLTSSVPFFALPSIHYAHMLFCTVFVCCIALLHELISFAPSDRHIALRVSHHE